MNKQELIDELSKNRDEFLEMSTDLSNHADVRNVATGTYVGLMTSVERIRMLDEPEKPIVKQFVADWFEKNKNDLNFAIYEVVAHSIKEVGYKHYPDGFMEWIVQSTNNPFETLIRMKDGYEVEKLPVFPLSQGDLVIRKGKHEAKIYIVESVDESGVLLVNGIKDEFYSVDDEGGPDNDLDYFYSNFRLLAKKESLEVEE